MRKLSRMMTGLLVGAALVAPVATQAQERGRGHGGWQGGGSDAGQRGGWQRGGGDAGQGGAWQRGSSDAGQGGAWQRGGGNDRAGLRGGDRGAMMNGDGRREAIEQAREAQRQVERPPVVRPTVPEGGGWRDNRGEGDRSYRGGNAPVVENRVERRRDMLDTDRTPNRWNNRDGERADRDRGDGDRRGWDRNRDGGRDRSAERRDWNRDGYRTWNRDANRSWSTDRRDWDRNDGRRWDRDWRNDRRYGWQSYRSSHRSVYRLPRYEARYGYSYRRWYPGYRWDPWFYSASFWISDPWQYRLPPAYGPYRWVRYYDDVVLVDIETGEIDRKSVV